MHRSKSLFQTLFLALSFLALSAKTFAATAAGQAIAVEGKVKAIASDRSERDIKRGTSFYSSEKIVVGADSKAQLKFSDGGLVNLIPLSEFLIESYSFKTPNQKDESVTNLAKGGFRALSGSIAKENPDNVTMKTPVATIGLRGTVVECKLVNGEAYVGCTEGKIQISNAYGSITIGAGKDRFATITADRVPISTPTRPQALAGNTFAPAQGAQPIESATEAVTPAPAASPDQLEIKAEEGSCT